MQAPPRRIALIPAADKDDAQQFAPELAGWLKRRGVEVLSEADIDAGRPADALVVLGGDGLMTHIAHRFPGCPILGINFGTVGFLAMVDRSEWETVFEHLLAGEFDYQDSPTLEVTVRRDGTVRQAGPAINDIVIRSDFRMIDVELYVDRQYVNTYPGDGMIVATPQGSTAYCMAAGGPILIAGVRGFAITPNAPHSPIRATLVVPEESEIEMVLATDREGHLIMDGVAIEELRRGDIIEVRRAPHLFRMILVEGMSFLEAFRSKFNYLIRPNALPSLGVRRGD